MTNLIKKLHETIDSYEQRLKDPNLTYKEKMDLEAKLEAARKALYGDLTF